MMLSLVLVLLGAATTVLGRHSVLGLCIGAGLMMAGWIRLEVKEVRG